MKVLICHNSPCRNPNLAAKSLIKQSLIILFMNIQLDKNPIKVHYQSIVFIFMSHLKLFCYDKGNY